MSGIGKIKYYYKLLNGDRVVTEGVTDDAKITFTNIEPGDYVFSVAPTPGSFDYNVLPAKLRFICHMRLCVRRLHILFTQRSS